MKKRIEIFNGHWTLDDVQDNPNKIFIYGDNDARTGKGGQAIIRGLSNTMGIRTKKLPTTKKDAYYTDKELDQNKKKILEDVNQIKFELMFGKTIVLSIGGYGTGLSKLKEKAPKTFEYLNKLLLDEFYFNNETGMSYLKIPSHREMMMAKELPMNYQHGVLGWGQMVPGQFRKELLDRGVTNTFEAIKSGLRTATSRSELFKSGDLIKVVNSKTKEILICRAITDSYPVTSISKEDWSKLEGWDINYFTLNPDAQDKFQFQFEWICAIDESGKQTFNPRLI